MEREWSGCCVESKWGGCCAQKGSGEGVVQRGGVLCGGGVGRVLGGG